MSGSSRSAHSSEAALAKQRPKLQVREGLLAPCNKLRAPPCAACAAGDPADSLCLHPRSLQVLTHGADTVVSPADCAAAAPACAAQPSAVAIADHHIIKHAVKRRRGLQLDSREKIAGQLVLPGHKARNSNVRHVVQCLVGSRTEFGCGPLQPICTPEGQFQRKFLQTAQSVVQHRQLRKPCSQPGRWSRLPDHCCARQIGCSSSICLGQGGEGPTPWDAAHLLGSHHDLGCLHGGLLSCIRLLEDRPQVRPHRLLPGRACDACTQP